MVRAAAKVSGPEDRAAGSAFDASGQRDISSPLDIVLALGERSTPYLSPDEILQVAPALAQMESPPLAPTETDFRSRFVTAGAPSRYADWLHRVHDFFDGTQVVSQLGNHQIQIPVTELHRPRKDGCKSSFAMGTTQETGKSLEVEVFGLNLGGSKANTVSSKDSFEAQGPCLSIWVPGELGVELCRNRRGQEFVRAHVAKVGSTARGDEITGDDGCQIPVDRVRPSLVEEIPFSVPRKTTQGKKLGVERAKEVNASAKIPIPGLTIGPKIRVKTLKAIEYEYSLAGPGKFVAFRPRSTLAFYWNVQ